MFKIGDKVKIVKECSVCEHKPCYLCAGDKEGIIDERYERDGQQWRIKIWDNEDSKWVYCHFHEFQLELIESYKKNIKMFGIVNFCKTHYTKEKK